MTKYCFGFFSADKADVTLTLSDADMFDLMIGKLNPQQAFYQVRGFFPVSKNSEHCFQGKLKISGNLGLAMKMQEFQKHAQKKLGEVKSKL